jgi:hypothetical protein
MKLKSYLKKNKNLIDKFDELYIHTNKLHYNGTENTEEDLTRIFLDKNIHRMARCCWDLVLSKEELECKIIGVPLAHISSLPFHHGTKVLNIVIKKEEE